MNDRSWRKVQIRIKKRDKNRCRNCGDIKNLCVHHIDFSGGERHHTYSNNNDNNLITLCGSCHGKEHWRFTKEKGYKNIFEALGDIP